MQAADDESCDVWREIKLSNTLAPRAAHSGDLIAPNLLVYYGGWNGADAISELEILDFSAGKWYSIDADYWPWRRNNHASVVVDRVLYIHGGHNGIQWLQDFHAVDLDGVVGAILRKEPLPKVTWYQPVTTGRIPHARACHTLTHVAGALILYGGYDGIECYRDLEVLDLRTMEWFLMQPSPHSSLPEGRNAHTMTLIGTKLYLFGGHAGYQHMGDLHTFDLRTRDWREIATSGPCPAAPRGHGAAFAGGHLVIFGGFTGKSRSQAVYTYNLATEDWRAYHTPISITPESRQRHTFNAIDENTIVLFGGFNGTNWLGDLYVLLVDEMIRLRPEKMPMPICALERLYKQPDFADMEIQAADGKLAAHKCLLASCSDYFRIALSADLSSNQTMRTQLNLKRWRRTTISKLLSFLYTGSYPVERQSLEELLDMLRLSHYIVYPPLSFACEETLRNRVLSEQALRNSRDTLEQLGDEKVCEMLVECLASAIYIWPDGKPAENLAASNELGLEFSAEIPLMQGASRGGSSHFLYLRSAAFMEVIPRPSLA